MTVVYTAARTCELCGGPRDPGRVPCPTPGLMVVASVPVDAAPGPRVPSGAVHPYRDPAPAPHWRLTPSRALVILAGLASFVALVQLVRVLGAAWQAG